MKKPPPETELTKSEEKTEVSAPAPAVPAKKPQSTFGAFSSKSSPFSTSASGSTSTSSPFASGSGSGSGSGSKPLSTGSAFGSYSSTSSPFARKSAFGAPATVDSEKEKEKSGDGAKEDETKKEGVNGATTTGSSFGDILKESKGDEEDQGDKVQMTEQDGTSNLPLFPYRLCYLPCYLFPAQSKEEVKVQDLILMIQYTLEKKVKKQSINAVQSCM